MQKIIYLVASIFLFTACDSFIGETTVTSGKKYSLLLPNYLAESEIKLSPDASLEYINGMREVYVIGIDEPKDEFDELMESEYFDSLYQKGIQGYADIIVNNMELDSDEFEVEMTKDTLIDNKPARIVYLKTKNDGLDIYFVNGYYQGKKDYYQINTWTLYSGKEKYKKQLEKIVYSFDEL